MSNYATREYKEVIDIKDDKKINLILETIPGQVKNIIDIGCGNGLITNRLVEHFDVLGIDINPTKLKHVKANTMVSSCSNISAPDQAYDMVFSSELLEHLDDTFYQSTLSEFQRLAKKYILITVPNRESLHKLMVKCQSCRNIYHKNGHLHSFEFNKLKELFPNFKLVKSFEYGQKIRSYHPVLARLKHALTPPSSWIPKLWSKKQGVNYSFCLHCGEKNEIQHKFHPLSFSFDVINVVVCGKHKSHLIALFERKSL